MTEKPQNTASAEPALPNHWAAEVEPQLAAGEKTQAWLEIDLDTRLQFAAGLVIVIDRCLFVRAFGDGGW